MHKKQDPGTHPHGNSVEEVRSYDEQQDPGSIREIPLSKQSQVEELASRLEAAYMAVIATAEKCTGEQWQMTVAGEERPVGVVFHHMAYSIRPATAWAMAVTAGNALPAVTREMVNEFNAQHAAEHAMAGQADTIALLRENGSKAIAKLRALSDEQLAMTAPFVLIGGNEIRTDQIMEWFILNHCHNHLGAIEKTLAEA